ncbi:hypothetical protein EV177_002244 [Coemansia sp. RSA 1804]|nr:hypothetical protein EV177_002244 [Coemansia sp. RSA 1804]
MAEVWSWQESRLISVVRCAERATQTGLHEFVQSTAYELVSIVHSVYSTATMESASALWLLFLGGTIIAYMFRPKAHVLSEIQQYRVEKAQDQDKITHDLFSGSLTVRAFGAYEYFGNRILEASEQEITVQQLAGSVIRTQALYESAMEMLVTFGLIGMLQLDSRSAGGGKVQNYYRVLTYSLPQVRYFTRFERKLANHMLNIHEFGMAVSMEPEEPTRTSHTKTKPQLDWPQRGQIRFKNCTMRYRADAEAVLKSMDFVVKAGERVGIVGRTGAGKSSILMALMRIVELESGTVLIDGVDTADVSLQDLRMRIGVVTQTPGLVEGTLRSNVDPFGQFSDEEIRSVVSSAQLGDAFEDLDMWIEPNGRNMSAGEQQLVGVWRVLLRRHRIVVLDEATANVDAGTARTISTMVNSQFKGSTIITIAHRLESVMGSDRVLVVDKGVCVEFGPPSKLAAQGGTFASLLEAERQARSSSSSTGLEKRVLGQKRAQGL